MKRLIEQKGKLRINSTNILLVEDNQGDAELAKIAFEEAGFDVNMDVVFDGLEALNYLFKKPGFEDMPTPSLVLLDLNLPKVHGMEVLEKVKMDDELKKIPIVILTTTDRDIDVQSAYSLHVNSYITKPVDLDRFIEVVKLLNQYWMTVTRLPSGVRI